jgi:hypothetical protein
MNFLIRAKQYAATAMDTFAISPTETVFKEHIATFAQKLRTTQDNALADEVISVFNAAIAIKIRETIFNKVIGFIPKDTSYNIWVDEEGSDENHKYGFLVYTEGGNNKQKRFEATSFSEDNGVITAQFDSTVLLRK